MPNRLHTTFRMTDSLAAVDDSSNNDISTHVLNFPRLMSGINRKTFHNVDEQGNAQLYTLRVQVEGKNCQALFTHAPNTYYTYKAIKAWHRARVKMFRRAGISMKSLTPYARTLRPYLDVNHENGTTTELDTEVHIGGGINPPAMGEWTYSRAAVATPHESTQVSTDIRGGDLVDTYSFTLLGDHVTEDSQVDDPDESTSTSDQDSYVSVGMIYGWLSSFSNEGIIGSNEVTDFDDNPLRQLMANSAASEEALEIAEDIELELPPWDRDGSSYQTGVASGYISSVGDMGGSAIIQVPCGLMTVALGNSDSASDNVAVNIDVLSIEDM